MSYKQVIEADILRWGKEQSPPVGRLLKKKDVMSYTGLSRKQVDKVLDGLSSVGSKTTYFYEDVAARLIQQGR